MENNKQAVIPKQQQAAHSTGTSIVPAMLAAQAASAAAAAAAAASAPAAGGAAPHAPSQHHHHHPTSIVSLSAAAAAANAAANPTSVVSMHAAAAAAAANSGASKPEVKRIKVDKPVSVTTAPPPAAAAAAAANPVAHVAQVHQSVQPSASSNAAAAAAAAATAAAQASSGPLVLANPPVPSPLPDSLTIRAMNSKLDAMWNEQKREMKAIKSDTKAQFKHISDLPLARIKRVMKSDEEVRMISAEAPILFAKACEMFVLDLTTRCYAYSEHNKRAGLEREDVFQVLKETNVYDFLAEVLIFQPVPK